MSPRTPASAEKMTMPLATIHYHQNLSTTTVPSPLQAYSDDAILSPSTFSPSNFKRDSFDDHLLEDGFPIIPKRRSWWSKMVLRARTRPDFSGDGVAEVLLPEGNGHANGFAALKTTRRKRGCWNYCLYGGISGLMVL